MKILSSFKPAETLTLTFILFLVLISSLFHKSILGFKGLILLYLSLFLVQLLLAGAYGLSRRSRVIEMVRAVIFPVIAVLVIFDSLGVIIHSINPKDIDPFLIRLDYLIFRGYPTVMIESIQSPLLTDILQAAYSTYYFIPISFCVMLKLQGREAAFDRSVFLILLCFYLSYAGYMLLPALGPRYTMHHLQTKDMDGLFLAEPVRRTLDTLEGIKRDAFPSGHTAVALVVSRLSYRFHKGYFLVTAPVIAMLIFSTVYCRYHYAVDVMGGIFLMLMTFFIGDRCYDYWEVRNSTHR
jgi:membrane-associated phospholipid phosphatase